MTEKDNKIFKQKLRSYNCALIASIFLGAISSSFLEVIGARWMNGSALYTSTYYGMNTWQFGLMLVIAPIPVLLLIYKKIFNQTIIKSISKKSVLSTIFTFIFVFLFWKGFVWCEHAHICMGGHMAHPPYPQWHFWLDIGWILAGVIAVGIEMYQENFFGYSFLYYLTTLTLFRLLITRGCLPISL